ncbi:hypothetical protein [Flavobacterium sp. WC2509]|uniref:hypothetical protein n=1 Tax=Flavobacterium sp. WC2509 TaxID=3461406 RepID=UPI004044B2F6
MDTERDENQDLRNDVDESRNKSNGTDGSHNQNSYDIDEENFEHLEEHDYAEDQNNSNTGYTEKLLEKESDQEKTKKDADKENDSDIIDDDLIIKNGNIADNDTEDLIQNDNHSDETLYRDND